MILLLSLLCIVPQQPAIAPPPRIKTAIYFPTIVGTKWIYQDGARESIEVITNVDEKAGIKYVTISSEWDGKLTQRYVLAVSEKGIAVVSVDAADLTDLSWTLKSPYELGAKWNINISLAGVGEWSGKNTINSIGKIQVPAGAFDTINVATDIVFLGERRQYSRWYAPGVGVIKETGGGSEDRVLKKFILGKE